MGREQTYNKVIIIGRLANDPKLDTSGKARFTLCNSSVSDGKEVVKFHQMVSSKKNSKLVMDYLKKGDLVCVEGPVTSKQVGEELKTTIGCERITFLTSKRKVEI